MAYDPVRTVVASAARTTSGDSGPIQVGTSEDVHLILDVTASSGTAPTLDIVVEWSHDRSRWADAGDLVEQILNVVRKIKRYEVRGPYYRIRWTIAGTLLPSFTFDVTEFQTG